MNETMKSAVFDSADEEELNSTTTIALLYLAERFPYRQFNTSELALISGLGRTAISRIKNAADTPFSFGKCTLRRLDAWLEKNPGYKQT